MWQMWDAGLLALVISCDACGQHLSCAIIPKMLYDFRIVVWCRDIPSGLPSKLHPCHGKIKKLPFLGGPYRCRVFGACTKHHCSLNFGIRLRWPVAHEFGDDHVPQLSQNRLTSWKFWHRRMVGSLCENAWILKSWRLLFATPSWGDSIQSLLILCFIWFYSSLTFIAHTNKPTGWKLSFEFFTILDWSFRYTAESSGGFDFHDFLYQLQVVDALHQNC